MAEEKNLWTDEDDATLRRLWKTEASLTQIGLEIGRSRNAVAGRRLRLDLPVRGTQSKGRPRPKLPKPPRTPLVVEPKVDLYERRPYMLQNDPPSPSGCPYIFGDPRDRNSFYCHEPVAHFNTGSRSTYCDVHHAQCYLTVRQA